MKYSKILLVMTVLVCLAFQAFALPVSDSQTNKSLSNTSLNNTTINNSSLKNSSLNNASLKNTSQKNASLNNASLKNTSLNNASLKNTSLNNASLKNSSLNNASLKNSSLNNASLKNTSLNNASLNSTMGSSGDYLNPKMGQVASFPWYTTGGSFYSQSYSDSMFSPFREYYVTSGIPVVGGIISTPAKFDITQKTPSSVYYGTGQALPYTQYVSTVPSKTNDLWVQGATNWAQYVVTPVGTWIQLVANAPVGGPAGFYEIVQTNTNAVKYNTYQFNQGYNTMNFNADQVGRHMLYFVVNNQPSNVVVVDVFAQAGSTKPVHTIS